MNTALCPKCRNTLSVRPGLKAGWCPVCHAGLKVANFVGRNPSNLKRLIMFNKTPKAAYIPTTGESFKLPVFRSGTSIQDRVDWIIANNNLSRESEEFLFKGAGLWRPNPWEEKPLD